MIHLIVRLDKNTHLIANFNSSFLDMTFETTRKTDYTTRIATTKTFFIYTFKKNSRDGYNTLISPVITPRVL